MKLSQAYRIALIAVAGFLLTAMFHRGAIAQAKSSQRVTNIVFVHGAWADGSSWSKVIPLLQGIAEDFAQDLPDKEKQVLTATQGSTAAAAFEATITTAAWKIKPSWYMITSNDRAVPPDLQKAEAAVMKATSITIPSSHVPMLSHPKEVADFIEQAAAKAGSAILSPQQ